MHLALVLIDDEKAARLERRRCRVQNTPTYGWIAAARKSQRAPRPVDDTDEPRSIYP
jgi:hypothetical protein